MADPNTSATGGFLAPDLGTTPLEDTELQTFVRLALVGITALPLDMVRQAFVKKGAQVPAPDVDWLSFWIASQVGQFDTSVRQIPAPTDEDPDLTHQQHLDRDDIELRCMFYGPNAAGYAARLRAGLHLKQNLEQLAAEDIGLTRIGPARRAPEEDEGQYVNRVDVAVQLSRGVKRVYPVLHFVGASGSVTTDHDGEAVETSAFEVEEGEAES